jgi:hypothetical protein
MPHGNKLSLKKKKKKKKRIEKTPARLGALAFFPSPPRRGIFFRIGQLEAIFRPRNPLP